jgi:hypothetical protein
MPESGVVVFFFDGSLVVAHLEIDEGGFDDTDAANAPAGGDHFVID